MEAKSVVKVGGVMLIALALFGALYLYLAHLNPNAYTIRVALKDTRGLLRQSVVRMQGVPIGEVSAVSLNTETRPPQPIVTLSIDKKFAIPSDSKFVVVSGLLITNPQIEIVPGAARTVLKDNVLVQGAPPTSALATLSPDLQESVTKLNKSFGGLNAKIDKAYGKIDKILDQTQTLMTTANKTLASTNGLIGDPRLKNSLIQSAQNLKEVTDEAHVTSKQLSRDLREMVASGRGKFDKVFDTTLALVTKIGNTVDEATTVVTKLTEQVTDPRLQQSLQETAELARTTLARFNQIASDIHQLSGDPQLQNDLKTTVEKLRETTESGQQAVEKVNTLLGKFTGPGGTGVSKPRLPSVELLGNVSEQIDPTRARVDVDSRFHFGKSLLDLGLYDLGQNTRLNLQYGNQLNDDFLLRYGLYASKLAVGAEWMPSQGNGIRADLWDTNRPRLDLKGLFRVNSDASLWVGADGLFRRPVPMIGIQFKH